ncbi:hypothetical protein ACQKRQ_09250 [Paraburkholderia sp. NPDC080076]|uniref:hypothetical protein n=1 Tax=Paraburkholderia sp. NPDC080076 TaxID=3390605 RepID=UPI003CFE9CF6
MIENACSKLEKSVSALHDLLGAINERPDDYASDAKLFVALKRQDRLAAFENEKYKVARTSRSSVERVCNKLLKGGFRTFDGLRVTALERLREARSRLNRPKRRTRDYYKTKTHDLDDTVQLGLMDCMNLTTALYKALEAGRELAKHVEEPVQLEYWRREEKDVLAMLSLVKKLVVVRGTDVEVWAQRVREL